MLSDLEKELNGNVVLQVVGSEGNEIAVLTANVLLVYFSFILSFCRD
ncbi:hypothetical protein ADU37_CDS13920 [Thermococcus sp. 2319x1]|nr:hypothetical protein ADU37_CDS13920 [Thermococcus sp. 2319x1]